jgi:hypothetical protein
MESRENRGTKGRGERGGHQVCKDPLNFEGSRENR